LSLQVIPNKLELKSLKYLTSDPFNEELLKSNKDFIQRYSDRIVIPVTNKCASYCRFCTRKWMWNKNFTISEKSLNNIIKFLKNNKNIREVIISGGEPFLIPFALLEIIIKKLFSVPSIDVIRIHTRILTFLPQMITNKLTAILSRFKPIWILTHFNHSNEITETTINAINKLIKAGIMLCNQSVLLKGVNDNTETMLNLVQTLESIRIKPYYLFQCDLVDGTQHFHSDLQNGIKILNDLRKRTSGLCIPTYVADLREGGKIPISSNCLSCIDNNFYKIKANDGKILKYPNIEKLNIKK
jgi:lysine 2,3-aminomutase